MSAGVIPPAAWKAIEDPALRGQPVLVYLFLLRHLRLQEWREVKVVSVRHGLRISKRGAIASLKLLVERGYLRREREAAIHGGGYRYLLIEEVPPRGSPTAPAQAA